MRRALIAKLAALGVALGAVGAATPASKPAPSRAWVADNGDGTYKNPVLFADYSDPDVIRVDRDFYLVASSFNAIPGLPILRSRDLVSWQLVGHVLDGLEPRATYDTPVHGGGVWAPSIRKHGSLFYVYFADADFGIFVSTAKRPEGPWSKPELVKAAKGWIDPCPFWDDDGKAYLVSAFAASRTGIKSTLALSRLSDDGKRVLDDGTLIFDGHQKQPTIEGPKLYKRNGYYYIAAPAGGVPTGWEVVLRSKSLYGPYEDKVVLAQGKTGTNGPHQGAWVDTPKGQFWFLHYQDRGAYGRVVHLEPMKWVEDWPVIGDEGEPVATHKKPEVSGKPALVTPLDSDEFDGSRLGLQWQWQANPAPGWALPAPSAGALRMTCVTPAADVKNLWDAPNLLLQKFPGPAFTATTKLTLTAQNDGEKAGLVVFGTDYVTLALERRGGELVVTQGVCKGANTGAREREVATVRAAGNSMTLRARVLDGGVTELSYSSDGVAFAAIGEPFRAQPGRWVGAKIGLFALRGTESAREVGYADVDWFRVE
ncbi:MAG TPA: glycoside hydrolase 43 family protein [Polyangiaceae bacterium]|nr:glycoside hydrolase 43 family protein [Polyangiaceae bacterium]